MPDRGLSEGIIQQQQFIIKRFQSPNGMVLLQIQQTQQVV
jgi:hypothetical protein